jgi:tetratricopeptide (TPR) repeat protein
VLAGEDGFRFRHLLIRDAAYDALPKAVRAELHERFAAWLEEHGSGLVELNEILGYHLEQACRYRVELGMPHDAKLAAAAVRCLTAAGRRADFRQDHGAIVSFLERAAALGPAASIDLALETDLIDALLWAGKGADALRRASSLVERASAAGDRVGALCGQIKQGVLLTYLEPQGATEKLANFIQQALPVFEAARDDRALYVGYSSLAEAAFMRGKMDKSLEAFERAATHAPQANMQYQLLSWRSAARLHGSTPVSELLAWQDEHEAPGGWSPNVRAHRAQALAMLGRFDEARAILAETCAELADRGGGSALASWKASASVVELLAGDPAAAAELADEARIFYEQLGERALLSTHAGELAQALYALGRLEQADAWAGRAAELGASDDATTQMLWRQVRAKVHARRGERAEAEPLARQAVAIAENTEMLDAQGDAHADLAEVLLLAGKSDEAAAELERALRCYERKGNRVSAERVQTRLGEL